MSKALNHRQEAFCRYLAEGLPQSRAYIEAGYSARGNSAEVHASILVRNRKVATRLAELQDAAAGRSMVTVDSLVAELDRLLQLAIECENPSAGVSAIMGKAKLLGLVVDRAEVGTTIRKPAREHTDRQTMSLEEWQRRYAPN